MESLLALDHYLFSLRTIIPHTELLNWFALALSGIGMGGFIWLLLSVVIFFHIERKEHWFFLPVILAAAASQLFSNMFLKDLFARNRPPGADLPDFSFPSGHATFAWALAIVLSSKEPRLKYFYYTLAFFISLSRIYLGKHYPADVLAGMLIGLAIGYSSLWVERLVIQYRYAQIKRKRVTDKPRRRKRRKRN